MKKFLCLLVALFLAGSIALAESIDLSSMTDDELLILEDQVSQEVSDRGLVKEFKVTPGMYIGGTDIKVGRYKAIVPPGIGYMTIIIAKDIDSASDRDNYLFYTHPYMDDDDDPLSYTFSISEGNVLRIYSISDIVLEKADMIG